MALQDTLNGKNVSLIDGFTPQQRLFLGWGQIWCENTSPQMLRLQVTTDPHAPAENRVNGVVRNMPEFQQAFHCAANSAMVGQPACRVW